MFEFTSFFEAANKFAPWVIAVVLGLVTLYGKAGIKGLAQLLSSFGTGIVIGGLFMCAALGFPSTFKGWYEVIMYGLAVGLTATGVYEVGKEIAAKAVTKFFEAKDEEPPVG